jgi:copper chaperone CopZ
MQLSAVVGVAVVGVGEEGATKSPKKNSTHSFFGRNGCKESSHRAGRRKRKLVLAFRFGADKLCTQAVQGQQGGKAPNQKSSTKRMVGWYGPPTIRAIRGRLSGGKALLSRSASAGTLSFGAGELLGEPSLKVTQLEVYGMCCQSEVSLVQKKLGVLPGVQRIRVNLMLRQVSVTHDEALAPPERLVRTLNWALLDARVVEAGAQSGTLLRRGRPTCLAVLLVLCLALFIVSSGTWRRVAEGDAAPPWCDDPSGIYVCVCVCRYVCLSVGMSV